MSDWLDTAIALQRQLLDAQGAALDRGEAMLRAQEASRRAAEANLAAWQTWARFWGMGPW